MQEINISEFKAKCLALMEEVRKTKKPLRVTRHGKPVAEIVPPSPAPTGRGFIGSGMKMFDLLDNDIVRPIIDFDEMEIFRE
jgi:prevent-host-death family protein